MARCSRCNNRKGKRHCPALDNPICSLCCGENRVIRIDCPEDCSYLETGEEYQKERRMVKAVSSGREYVNERTQAFREEDEFIAAMSLEHAFHMLRRAGRRMKDKDIVRALDQLPMHLGSLEIVTTNPDPLAATLAMRMKNTPEFEELRKNKPDICKKTIARLEEFVKRMTKKASGETVYLDFIATYFDSMVTERELQEERAATAPEDPDRASDQDSPGGIILP